MPAGLRSGTVSGSMLLCDCYSAAAVTRGTRQFCAASLTNNKQTNKQTNSVAPVRKRTIPTERPPLVGEVSANFFLRTEGVAWSARRIPTAVFSGF
jgi:hypothetical protein